MGDIKTTTNVLLRPVSAIPSLPFSPQSQSCRPVCVVRRLGVESCHSMKMISGTRPHIAMRESEVDLRSEPQGTRVGVGQGTTRIVGMGSWKCC